jgi:hypothetical protein
VSQLHGGAHAHALAPQHDAPLLWRPLTSKTLAPNLASRTFTITIYCVINLPVGADRRLPCPFVSAKTTRAALEKKRATAST